MIHVLPVHHYEFPDRRIFKTFLHYILSMQSHCSSWLPFMYHISLNSHSLIIKFVLFFQMYLLGNTTVSGICNCNLGISEDSNYHFCQLISFAVFSDGFTWVWLVICVYTAHYMQFINKSWNFDKMMLFFYLACCILIWD